MNAPVQLSCLAALLLSALPLVTPAAAGEQADKAAITAAIHQWADDFNNRRADRVCDLFAPELRFDFHGMPERGHAEICAQLNRALTDASRRMTNQANIKEIMVSGDLAMVRLVWTETVSGPGAAHAVDRQTGLDVFRRQPDGSWKIVRFIAFGEE